MNKKKAGLIAVAVSGAMGITNASAETGIVSIDELDLSIGGFIRADYGNGDRYPDSQGNDRLGVTKAALAVTSTYQNVKGVFVSGTEVTSEADGTTNGDVDIKDAFIVISKLGGSAINLSVGAQPLLFGLKPNGYPDDHTIQGSVEYGAGGGLAVARQAGPSIIVDADIGSVNLRGGFFDLDSGTSDALSTNGSSLTDNFFVQAYAKDIGGSGFYGVVGFESIYVNAQNDGETITSVGFGWKNSKFDISAERITLDKAINSTIDEESYTVVEAGFKVAEGFNVYADYSTADEAQFDTIRTGVNYDYNKHTSFTVEYSKDSFEFGEDFDSIDIRVAINF
jgi:hypothetical protein